jgi:hypothetical protein
MFEPMHIELAKVRYHKQPHEVEQAPASVPGPGPIEWLRLMVARYVIALGRQLQGQSHPQKIGRW